MRGADRATRVEVKARVEGGVAFLRGAVDSRATLDRVAAAAADVFGVRAVDTRGIELKWRRHTVAPGDTLVGLAREYYGDATAWPRIWQANTDLAHGPTGIRAGTVLVIPTGPP
ncbi:MAG: LysM peptidoglycan-binding domain-containing protein [Myxococcales bacterium]|nr:LysM peptidoglycan-binding domain-containing protein [Myxococcales bacterium]